MDQGSQPKSRLVSVTFARELLCLNRVRSMFNITSQWQDSEILDFFVKGQYYEKLGHMLKPLEPKFCSDLSIRSRDITEKKVPEKLMPIVGSQTQKFQLTLSLAICNTHVALLSVWPNSFSITWRDVGKNVISWV